MRAGPVTEFTFVNSPKVMTIIKITDTSFPSTKQYICGGRVNSLVKINMFNFVRPLRKLVRSGEKNVCLPGKYIERGMGIFLTQYISGPVVFYCVRYLFRCKNLLNSMK